MKCDRIWQKFFLGAAVVGLTGWIWEMAPTVALNNSSDRGTWDAATPTLAQQPTACPGGGRGRGRGPHHGRGRGRGPHHGRGPGNGPGRMYNPATVETIRGTVREKLTYTPNNRNWGGGGNQNQTSTMPQGIHLRLQPSNGSQSETMLVRVGPSWYLNEAGMPLEAGSRIEVTGSRVNFAGTEQMVASQIRHQDRVVTLRDENGIPQWRGSGYRAGNRGCWRSPSPQPQQPSQ
ncbi:hypothetical protein [Geitlerinema sp. PCC 9228]|uniref:hypothetical protein n=1 Tax=Geitlerinema sp. PCC 9228 TaxID=111611 RepID=UPI0008F9AF1A|nr:hypothetical protein [Geitlerinema sp. PCC 9228]